LLISICLLVFPTPVQLVAVMRRHKTPLQEEEESAYHQEVNTVADSCSYLTWQLFIRVKTTSLSQIYLNMIVIFLET